MTNMAPALELIDVRAAYGRIEVLRGVTLIVPRGSVFALLGPNGAGKSTLMGVLSTLVAPTSGTVRFGNHLAREVGAGVRARIGLLAHELHLYPELSARQNLTFFARLYGLESAAIESPESRLLPPR